MTSATATSFMTYLQRQEKTKEKNELVGLHQDKKFLHSKGNSHQPTEWEKIFANETTDKRLVFKIYKELLKLNTRETDNQMKKWAEDINRHFSNEDI